MNKLKISGLATAMAVCGVFCHMAWFTMLMAGTIDSAANLWFALAFILLGTACVYIFGMTVWEENTPPKPTAKAAFTKVRAEALAKKEV